MGGPPPAADRRRRSAGPQRGAAGATLTPAQLADLLAETFGIGSLLIGMAVGVRALAMSEAEATAIAGPASLLIARSRWYKLLMRRLGRAAADTPDVWALVLALVAYALRVADEIGVRVGWLGRHGAPASVATAPMMAGQQGATNGSVGHTQAATGPGGHPSAAPSERPDIHVLDGIFGPDAYGDIPAAYHPVS